MSRSYYLLPSSDASLAVDTVQIKWVPPRSFRLLSSDVRKSPEFLALSTIGSSGSI